MKTTALAVAVMLAAGAGAGEWKVEQGRHPMTDAAVYAASAISRDGKLSLAVTCTVGKKAKGGIVLTAPGVINWRFAEGARRARVDFRFGDEKAVSRLGEVVDSGGTWVMVNSSMTKNEPRDFVKALGSHSRLLVQPPMYEGAAIDAFDLAGFPATLFPKGCF